MFKNPLRKYQQGGTAPTQEQQKLLAAFIEWLPKRVKEFQGMQPDAIAQALDGMSKTPEGQQQIQQLMQQFQQEIQGNQQAFRNGGKIHDFICKHAHGGVADCGCGNKIQKGENGIQKVARFGRNVMRTTPIGKYLLAPEKNEGYRDAEWGASRLPDINGITNRRGGVGRDINGNPVYYLGEVVNGTSADSYYIPSRGVIEQNIAGYPDQIRRTYEPGSEEYESVYNRFLPLIPTEQEGGKVEKARNGKRVNNKTRTITEVGNGLNKYDAEDLGIDPNTLVDTSSIITAYPNGKPYVVNGQLPFWSRNGIAFQTGGIESSAIEDGSRLGKPAVPGRKYKVSTVGGQDHYANEDAMEYPVIMRYASPVDTVYNLGFQTYGKSSPAYSGIREMYNSAINHPNTFAWDAKSYSELQRQKQENKK